MVTVAPPADQAADMVQKITLDPQSNSLEVVEATKKQSVDSNNATVNGVESDRSGTPLLPDITDAPVSYQPNGLAPTTFYYGGYDGLDCDFGKFMGPEGVEMSPGAYGENTPLMYHPGYSYSHYPPYSPVGSPVPALAHDGQLYGSQQYQYPSPYFQSMAPPTNGPYSNPTAVRKGEMAASTPSEQAPLPVDSTKSKSSGIANNGGLKANNGPMMSRAAYPNSSFNMNGSYGCGSFCGAIPASGFQDPRYVYDGLHSPMPWMDSTYYSDGQPSLVTSSSTTASVPNLQHPRPLSGLNAASGYINRLYPKLYGDYGSTYRSGLGYGSNDYSSRPNGRGFTTVDSKYRPRGRESGFYYYGNESMDGLNELNRGPRTKSSKSSKSIAPVALAIKGQTITLNADNNEKSVSTNLDRDQYNRQDFPEQYSDAKFFVIKSYSEDDVHKSIKYSIWSSTDNGNRRLDAAYQEAQQKSGGCPVFLFFSVNTSGQFVGVAEMIGPVDFNKNVEYWQQDKWIGCFPVKWHIVKDVPNGLLKHITLENNENKPVTNSRDTQEVKLEQGLKVLKIFKDHPCRQCVLDDFDFYEERQKKIQEKKGKLRPPQQKQGGQLWEGKPTEEIIKSAEPPAVNDHQIEEIIAMPVEKNGSGGDSTAESRPPASLSSDVVEKKIVVVAANGC